MKMSQTTAKYERYDDGIMAGTKSTETEQVLKDNTKQTRYDKTRPDLETDIQMTSNLICSIKIL